MQARCYARGLDAFHAAYRVLDRAPRRRKDDDPSVAVAWVRRHDEYYAVPR
ncbi:DUF899 family protein [Mycobacterium xenopi]|uniref:Uncharacterized protein n=1 Tax=Mycobacterium xenopi 4042 TaxID=1299334 RepID=X8CJE3_MYCXE|nr:DUF899 family protein [Mycobacterium xenopi]EUA43461.1 hypothetical protein I552_8202 [Mycobacterium xenopi 3993]EUA56497.1 hypothetical protein I553_8545 [Mycobacterium xenopi 4042]EID12554.1 hypothetical protein MXEN_12421 [Mycobacterium xenopi RIVM700367]MDA3641056.1 DUF899 family protein [Mycobacterium xenopi]MDA3656510.1 DUF899 family protein [Mycobacterium xenopi]